jgi:peroxiredoxin
MVFIFKIIKTIALMPLLLITLQFNALGTTLTGKAPGYSNREITFYTISDPVLNQKLELGTSTVSSDGTFSIMLRVNQTMEIYADLEKYCATMVVEPGKDYRIELPPFSPRTIFEARSAYFKPALYWLGLPGSNNSDLNYAVRSFITDYNSETVHNTKQIYQQQSKEVVGEIIERLEKRYATNQNEYFRILKQYYFAELEYALHQRTPEYIIRKYFATQPVQLIHPVYQRVFETIFTDFLRKQAQQIQNNSIITITDSGNYSALVNFFEKKGYQHEFAELVVIKGLNDGYYTGSFSKEGIIRAIKMALTTTASPALQTIANQIKSRLSLLAVGAKAPAITLLNNNQEPVNLEQFAGKFIYLTFFNSKSSDCITDLDSIVPIAKKLRQVLTVVSVSVDDDFEVAARMWKTKGYSWVLLNGSKQKQLIINYKASIPPVYYLIAPDGKIKLSPAPSPTHGFEPMFLKVFRDYNFKH